MHIILFKRERIVKKAVQKTLEAFSKRTPKIYQYFYYGAIDIEPRCLVVWYLFETDAELASARACGYCDELAKATMNNLFALGYPKDAFDMAYFDVPVVMGATGGDEKPQYKKGLISFTTKEDVDKVAQGDYYLYFK